MNPNRGWKRTPETGARFFKRETDLEKFDEKKNRDLNWNKNFPFCQITSFRNCEKNNGKVFSKISSRRLNYQLLFLYFVWKIIQSEIREFFPPNWTLISRMWRPARNQSRISDFNLNNISVFQRIWHWMIGVVDVQMKFLEKFLSGFRTAVSPDEFWSDPTQMQNAEIFHFRKIWIRRVFQNVRKRFSVFLKM